MSPSNADLIIFNGTVVTQDKSYRIFSNGFVAVQGSRIAAVDGSDTLSNWTAAERIDAEGGLIIPGLVNTHVHLPMSLFRGLADDLPLMTWLNEYIFPAEAAHLNPESVRAGTLLSCAELLLSGTTTCCGGYFLETHVAEAVLSTGLRAVLGQGVIDYPAPGVPDPTKNVSHAEGYVKDWRQRDDRITPAIFCHSPYTCSADTLKRAKAAARSAGVLFQIHVAETESERDQMLAQKGGSPVQYLADLGLLDENTLLVHGVWLDEKDIELIAASGAGVSHNPESNMKLGSGIAPVCDLLAAGVPVGLGTDGCASNNDLDLFSEMDTAAKLHKAVRQDPTVMTAAEVFRMATRGGAKVIGLENKIGSLEKGMEADIVVLGTRQPHAVPLYNPLSHLVYSARAADVRHVVVAGRSQVEDGRLLNLAFEEISKAVVALSQNIRP